MPAAPRVRLGVWEDGTFIGAIVFARGASNGIAAPFGIGQTEVVELARVALTKHSAPVTRILRIALAMLHRHSPGLRLIVSYADPAQEHVGTIYQAGNWIYAGHVKTPPMFLAADGRLWHSRMVSPTGFKLCFGKMRPVVRPADCQVLPTLGKLKYLMPLDKAMREQIAPLAKPYPCAGSIVADAPPIHGGEGGSTPTPALAHHGE